MAAGKWNRNAGAFPAHAGAFAGLALVAALAVSLSGCSLVGLGVGSVVDATRSREPLLLSPERAAYLPIGTPLTLVMVDSSTIHGVVLDPQFPNGLLDSRRTGVRLAHLHSDGPASIDTLFVPFEQISYARAARVHHGARTGFHAGLMADLTVLGIAAAAVLLILLILLMASSSGFSFG